MLLLLRFFTFFSKSKKSWLFTFFCRVSYVFSNYALAGLSSHLLSRLQSVMNAGLSFPRQSSSTPLRSFVSCTGWRPKSGLHSNMQSSCTSVNMGPHLHTLLTSFVRWQMSRLVSDCVPVPPHHWLSAAPDSLMLATEISRSPLHVSGTVCQILSLPHLP